MPRHRKLLFLQSQKFDCVPAAVKGIFQYYQIEKSFFEIKMELKTDSLGTTMYDMVDFMEGNGFLVEAYDLIDESKTISTLSEIIGKNLALCNIEINDTLHSVVVYKVSNKFVYLMNPEKGFEKVSEEKFLEIWNSNVFVIYKEKNKRIKWIDKNNVMFKLLGTSLLENKKRVYWVALLQIGLYLAALLISYLYGIIFNDLIPQGYVGGYFLQTIVLYLIIVGCSSIAKYLAIKMIINISNKVQFNLFCKFSNAVAQTRYSVFSRYTSSQYLNRLNEVDNILVHVMQVMTNFSTTVFMFLITTLLIFYQNFILGLIFLVNSLLNIKILQIYYSSSLSLKNEVEEKRTNLIEKFTNLIEGFSFWKNYRKEDVVQKGLRDSFLENIKSSNKFIIHLAKRDILLDLLYNVSSILILFIGAVLIINNQSTIGGILTISSLFSYYITSVKNFNLITSSQAEAQASLNRMEEIFDFPEDISNDIKLDKAEEISVKIESFRYTRDREVLSKRKIDIKKGKTTKIIGGNGSGKSTLSKLLSGLVTGEGVEGYVNKKKIDIGDLKNYVVYLGSDNFVLSETLGYNIFLSRQYDIDKLKKVVEDLSLPKKLEELIVLDMNKEVSNNTLSSGEKQIIAILRAIVSNREYIILDEVLSKLEYSLAVKVFNYLKANKTIVIVHHGEDFSCDEEVVL